MLLMARPWGPIDIGQRRETRDADLLDRQVRGDVLVTVLPRQGGLGFGRAGAQLLPEDVVRDNLQVTG